MTGGKAAVSMKNLFGISVSATEYDLIEGMISDDESNIHWKTGPVTPASITVMGKNADTNGMVYTILPDNATMDCTPQAPPQNYTYSVAPAKYESYFTVFVDMPAPPPKYMVLNGLDGGHAWWCFSSDVPLDVLNLYTTTNQSHFLNEQVGYADHGHLRGPGLLRDPETDQNISVQKTYAIGFDNLISGLAFTQNLHDNPGMYLVRKNNCVVKVIAAGAAAGVGLPGNDASPERFGWAIYRSQ
jgi:hypothetical protein